MKNLITALLSFVLTVSPFCFVDAQEQSPQKPDEVLRVRTNEVRLDVVVKDKKGHAIRDLNSGDFEILEDGVPQQIRSFNFVNRESVAPSIPKRASDQQQPKTESPQMQSPPSQRTTPGVTALVFDRLSTDARTLARKAGLAYAQEGMAAGDFTGVFRIDLSLHALQQFTDNSELVKAAIDNATSSVSSSFQSSAQQLRDSADRSAVLDRQADSSASDAVSAGGNRDSAAAAAAGQAAGQAAAEQEFLQMQANILQQFETLERDQQGFATINGLLAVINPMRNLPGRKTIIFFSEGIALPPAVQTKFPSVISAANKANVSIYTIDAAGLRTESAISEAAKELNSLSAQRMQQQARGSDRGMNGPQMKSLERNEDLLRFDPRSGLGQLADETGGIMIHDTNDLANGLRRINDDMHAYYMITYVPKNEDYDGRFRRINVKLNHANFEVQTRKGYYAVESVGQLAVLDYEAPAIASARDAHSESNPFIFHGAALSFPATNTPGRTLILAEAPMSAFNFATATDKKTYAADFAVVALVRDQSGQAVQKLSQHYPLSGPIDQLESARKGDLLFYRETQLPPGNYQVELIAYDAATKKTSVHTSALQIAPGDETRPRLSSVSILKRAEKLNPQEQLQDQPFHFGELIVYPNLGLPIPKSKTPQLAFFVTAWPSKGNTASMSLTFEILQHGRALATSTAALPAPDDRGQIKYASSFSLKDFQPGIYELKVTVSDTKNRVSRSTSFTLGS